MIITLSRQLGSGGDEIAARLAAALGLRLVDRETVHQAALAAGVPLSVLQQLTYDSVPSLAAEILSSLRGVSSELRTGSIPPPNPLFGVFTPLLPPVTMTSEEGVQTIGLIIKDIASQDQVLVLGQGGQTWLRDYTGACHVQVVAPFPLRMQRLAEELGLSLADARRQVRMSDMARADYLARYHGVNWTDPLLYHVVINTGSTPVGVAVSIVLNAAQALAKYGA